MKTFFKSKIFYFILFAFILSISAVFAYSYVATDVGFTPTDTAWNVKNVSSALNSLRNEHIFEHFSDSFLNGSMFGVYESKNVTVYSGGSRVGEYISLNSYGALYAIMNLSLPAGCYFFLVYGDGFTNKFTPDMCDSNTLEIFWPKVWEYSNNYTYYYINLPNNVNKGEFRIWNNSDNPIKIKTLMVFNPETCPY